MTMPIFPFHLGLTGGIGSGKSTVASMLAERGAGIIDADAISRATTAVSGSAIPLIRVQFGNRFIAADGALDREQMRKHIFENPQAKAQLESIIHPLVGQHIAAQTRFFATAGRRCIVFDIPLLVESGHWRKNLQRVLVVDCRPQTQISRVCMRSGLAASDVQKIMAVQVSRSQRLAAADIVLYNDGISLSELGLQVQQIGQPFGL
jgi:dephospho-CoA kinase